MTKDKGQMTFVIQNFRLVARLLNYHKFGLIAPISHHRIPKPRFSWHQPCPYPISCSHLSTLFLPIPHSRKSLVSAIRGFFVITFNPMVTLGFSGRQKRFDRWLRRPIGSGCPSLDYFQFFP
ncbi:hypothetical protein [[Phormidium] sp. ETS-05]|uniref:hypothetical protein n=1 Tax=[Phormidium] sp. ETS-05 TaxID=222819 RepID=UPI0018EF1678|nr:hypothetical protein [[Phormidium] sp. ETS-05]